MGFTPVAPGTAGSLVAAVLLWAIPWSTFSLAVTLCGVILAGIWAAGRVERLYGRKDPGVIVIDEVAGMIVAVAAVPRTPLILAAAFLCFRALDIVKPFPARQSQSLAGGLGVVVDDLVAGAYTLVLLAVSLSLIGWPA